MQKYNVTLTGATPLLMHNDNLSWADAMKQWQLDPANKKLSVAGDDRTPAWKWLGCLYVENHQIVVPSDNLMTALREGGKKVQTGKGQQTFKSQTQSGIIVDQSSWPLLINNNRISDESLNKLIGESNFEKHKQAAKELGFELFVKRAKIGNSKHVRVRPRFDTWSASGSLTVLDETITAQILESILTISGAYCGICDWRPSSPKAPGPFGKFFVELTKV